MWIYQRRKIREKGNDAAKVTNQQGLLCVDEKQKDGLGEEWS